MLVPVHEAQIGMVIYSALVSMKLVYNYEVV